MAYCPARNQCIFTTIGADRSTEEAVLDVAAFTGETVHTYLGFISADGKNISNSYFTGELDLTP
ncbi:MAG: hypothetical protein JJE22_17030 [Bacteroidia bacterium]|nr:hypothetical protein [Bacteroidia bacterium]